MRHIPIRSLSAVLFTTLLGCGSAAPSFDSSHDGSQVNAQSPVQHEAGYESLYLRGTMNGWGTTPMVLLDDHAWQAEVTTGDGSDQRFKFDVYGDWSLNFGDNDGDQIADQGGQDIPLPAGKRLVVHFDDVSRFYWVEERTWQAEVSIVPPQGLNPASLRMRRAKLSIDGQPYGWNDIYVDGDHAYPYAPVCCLSLGAEARLAFDDIVDGKRLVGEASWTVDGAQDPVPVEMRLGEASLEEHGAVELTVLSDRWEWDHLVAGPFSGVGVFLGDWQAGHSLGYTDDAGRVSFMVPAGDHKISAMVMTSSHSMASAEMWLTVGAGQVVQRELHMAPITVYVHAHYDTGVGKALYITGASDYLGNWQTAARMDWNGAIGAWTYTRNLPIGAPFKVVLAPWSDEPSISTQGVQWEQGPNHTITPPNGYVSSDIAVYPSF